MSRSFVVINQSILTANKEHKVSIFKFGLGDEIQDRISKFKGIIVSRTEWFNGCIRYVIAPQSLKDGKLGDEAVFDEAQITLVKANKVQAPFSEPLKTIAASAALLIDPPKVRIRTGGPRRDMKSPSKDGLSRSRR
jgi:hypothetical protein